jgi:hypothetical protein
MYSIPTESDGLKQVYGGAEMPEGLPELKPEDQAVSMGAAGLLMCVLLCGKWLA